MASWLVDGSVTDVCAADLMGGWLVERVGRMGGWPDMSLIAVCLIESVFPTESACIKALGHSERRWCE